MSEIVKFVQHGASHVTPALAEKVLRCIPAWKVEFAQISEPKYPHLSDQLEFLADVVEDVLEGAYKDLPYVALAQAVFALIYAHQQTGIIPNYVPELGRADDSSIVRAVLLVNEKALSRYAEWRGLDWSRIPTDP